MTSEDLAHLVKKGPTNLMVAQLGPLSEADRKGLSKSVADLRKEFAKTSKDHEASLRQAILCPQCGSPLGIGSSQQCVGCGAPYDISSLVNLFRSGDRAAEQRLKLAVLAVCPWTEAQRIRGSDVNPRELIFQVLADRKPEWLSRWIDKELGSSDVDWRFIRRFVRAGLCPTPQSERYILEMIRGLGFDYAQKKSLKQHLLDDPDLLTNEIWRIFELVPARETIIPVSDAGHPGSAYVSSWAATLRELSQEGKLDRQRLLAASLSSLAGNTEARNTGWFQKFHELLEPTPDERQRLHASYLQLLNHPIPGVAGMALSALAILEKAKLLDAAAFLDAAGPVFHLAPKVQPMALIKLLTRLATTSKERTPRIAEMLIAGLSHPAPQVQEAALQQLSKLRNRAGDVIAAGLPAQIDALAPSLQDQARKLLAQNAPEVPEPAQVPDASPVSDLLDEARKIPSPWREALGIDPLLQAIEGNGELSAVSFDSMAVPRLRPEDRVQPIQTLDELIERMTVAVEGLDDPIEFELLVDGLSRLCDQRPDDFQARVAPMLARILKLLPMMPGSMASAGLRFALFKLILRWGCGDLNYPQEDRNSILGFLDVRLGLVWVRMRDRQPAPLLACPTHRHGWIDPAEMAARLRAYQQRELEPAKHDFIQGVLRLAPDGRANALASAGDLRGKYAAAFRYALGGPLEDASLPAAVLIAAGRARTPQADLTELSFLKDIDGPDALHPACYSWQVNSSEPDSLTHWARLHVSVDPSTPTPDKIRDLPTVLLHPWRQLAPFAWEGLVGLNRWKTTVWPSNLDSCFALGARVHTGRDSQASLLRQRANFLEPLFDPSVPFSEMAQLLLAISLNEQAPEVTGMAVDVLVEVIRDGRCVGAELGRVLGRMLPHPFIKLNRLGKHLDTVARASLLHTHVCAQIVQEACAPLEEPPRDAHFLLGPLLEWLSSLEEGVRDECRLLLEKAKSGNTGALARKLLRLPSAPTKQTAILVEALRGRLHVAQGWTILRASGPSN
jgi:Family of unknown function (DUF6493)